MKRKEEGRKRKQLIIGGTSIFVLLILIAFFFILSNVNSEKDIFTEREYVKCEEFYAARSTSLDQKQAVANEYEAFSNPKIKNAVDWDWTCVGPNIQPQENDVPSSAIPSYARGRGNGTGRINFLHYDEAHHRLFACSPTGGLFLSKNNGKKWTVAGTDQLPISGVSTITTNPLNKKQWILATGDGDDKFMFSDGLWRTMDQGKSYENINGRSLIEPAIEIGERLYSCKVLAHPCDFNRVFYASNQGLFVSNNALDEAKKVRWKQMAFSHFYDIEILPSEPSVVFASGEELMMSMDCGATWEKRNVPVLPGQEKYPFRRISIECTQANGEFVYAVITRGTQFSQSKDGAAFLYKYRWKEDRWELQKDLSEGMGNMLVSRARAFTVSPIDSNLVLCGNVKPVYRSLDGGKSFEKIEKNQMHDDLHHLLFAPNEKHLWAAHDGGVSVSKDGGLTFENSDEGIGVSNTFGLDVAQSQEEILVYGAYDTGGNQLDDRGWTHVNWGDGFDCAIDPRNSQIRYTTRQFGYIHMSEDGGETYPRVASSRLTRSEWHSSFKISPKNPEVLFSAGSKVVRSSDYAKVHEVILDVKTIHPEALTCYKVFVSENHPNVVYAYILREEKHRPLVAVCMNAMDPLDEVSWTLLPELPKNGWISDLVVDEKEPSTCWLVYKDPENFNTVCRFNGKRFVDVSANLKMMVCHSLCYDPVRERLYLGSNQGVFSKSKDEREWTLLDGLPGTYIEVLRKNKVTRTIYAGTFGRGIWKAPLLEY